MLKWAKGTGNWKLVDGWVSSCGRFVLQRSGRRQWLLWEPKTGGRQQFNSVNQAMQAADTLVKAELLARAG